MERPAKRQKLLPLPVTKEMKEAVILLCQQKQIDGPPRHKIVAFLGLSQTVSQVCKTDCPRMLQQLIERDAQVPSDSLVRYPEFVRWQFRQGLRNAVAQENLVMVKVLVWNIPDFLISVDVLCDAAARGRLDIIQWLFANRAVDNQGDCHRVVGAALEGGHLEVAKWLLPWVHVPGTSFVLEAVKSGNLEAVQWAYEQSAAKDIVFSKVIDAAMASGKLVIVAWLVKRLDVFVDLATPSSLHHSHIIEWLLLNHRCKCIGFSRAMAIAAGRGWLDIVCLLHKFAKNPGMYKTMELAARNGHLHIVEWLHLNSNGGCTKEAMDAAAGNGHLDVVKWLHLNRSERCTEGAMNRAAAYGFLNVVKWLAENRREDCTTIIAARTASRVEHAFPSLLKDRYQRCSVTALDAAASEGHLDVVVWLSARYPRARAVYAMDGAAQNGHLHVVKWLHLNRNEGCTVRAMDGAAKNGILKW
ncbi:unnamed protein product [Phytophthora lilii]|uniref:Unnamed protein product n=1 Tax=Phytophthora lilii TaxID=2077276 RepID=A0A9W6WQ79_9STRA|nr:unnamed protein product [Phytophthora lilii]